MTIKLCTVCDTPFSATGSQKYCGEACLQVVQSAKNRAYYKANREHAAAKKRAYAEANREHIVAKKRAH